MREPLIYIDCSLPQAITIAEYRRSRCAHRQRRRRLRRGITRATAGLLRL